MEAAVGSMASSHQERVSRRLGREYGSDQHETASYTGAGQSDAWKIRIPERRNPQARAGTSP